MPAPRTIIPLNIERLTLGGDGVGHSNGLTVFVPNAAPGDQLDVELTESRPRFARGRLVRVRQASADRITPPCPYHFHIPTENTPAQKSYCGGCSWQHITYQAQLASKRTLVKETLERLGGLTNVEVMPVLGMKEPWRYRNKVQEPVGWSGQRLVSGFFSPGSHDLVAIDDCLVQPELSVALINGARSLLDQTRAKAYDSVRHQGWIRHLLARTSSDGKAMLVFVTRTPEFAQQESVVGTLRKSFPSLVGVFQNVNPGNTNVILGREWRTLAGVGAMEERLGTLRFQLSPASFFQVNSRQAEVLYDVAASFVGRGPKLLDLYCGVGTIALWLADRFDQVGGVEEVRAAIDDAGKNAALNDIKNARFQTAPVEEFIRQMDRSAGGPSLTVTLDPPRAGCKPEVIQALLRLRPGTIVYVSCDPGTLARDLGLLVKGGYRVKGVQPVDLFPHTPHIETVVKLTL